MPTVYYALIVAQPPCSVLDFALHKKTKTNALIKITKGATVEIITESKQALKDAIVEHVIDIMATAVQAGAKEHTILVVWGEKEVGNDYTSEAFGKKMFVYAGFKPKNFIVIMHMIEKKITKMGCAFKDEVVKVLDEEFKRLEKKSLDGYT